MKKFAMVLTLLVGTVGAVPPADAIRMVGWYCRNWTIDGVNYTMCCRDSDGYCTGVYVG